MARAPVFPPPEAEAQWVSIQEGVNDPHPPAGGEQTAAPLPAPAPAPPDPPPAPSQPSGS